LAAKKVNNYEKIWVNLKIYGLLNVNFLLQLFHYKETAFHLDFFLLLKQSVQNNPKIEIVKNRHHKIEVLNNKAVPVQGKENIHCSWSNSLESSDCLSIRKNLESLYYAQLTFRHRRLMCFHYKCGHKSKRHPE